MPVKDDLDRWNALPTRLPDWFRDAPLGIFVHWGAYAVPAWAELGAELGAADDGADRLTRNPYAEWYANTIRIEGSPAAEHHRTVHDGAPYDDFLDTWQAERFDPGAWAELFRRTGADYVVLTTKHHDGIPLWDAPGSGDRNTARRGPRRDLVGEIVGAAEKEGLRFGVYYSGGLDWHVRPTPPLVGGDDVHDTRRPRDDEYGQYCAAQVRDLIDRYSPDVLWNDIGWPDQNMHFGTGGLGELLEHFYRQRPEGLINVALSEIHQNLFMDELHRELGVEWTEREGVTSRAAVPDIVGMPATVRDTFSSLAAAIYRDLAGRVARFRSEYDRDPSHKELLDLKAQAWRATRKPKDKEVLPLSQRCEQWRARAVETGQDPEAIIAGCVERRRDVELSGELSGSVHDVLVALTIDSLGRRQRPGRNDRGALRGLGYKCLGGRAPRAPHRHGGFHCGGGRRGGGPARARAASPRPPGAFGRGGGMSVRAPRDMETLPPAQRAAMQMALENAVQRAAAWGLPELTAAEPRTRAVGWLTRDRALVVIERDLVSLGAQRRRRAPWGQLWAPDWWDRVILPAAAEQPTAAWWARRAPRAAIEWARLLDPSGDVKAGRDTGRRDAEERES